ncbi:ArnT family glycosyltransferase [Halpernia frigidisoli]|uniref:4-amino-4-deoxy-L-arabinose transferase n=1 Tax=Halpernia frigidisoli TaxID=1125876 RepID=A0A1I3GVD2_9FLAO|nr:glycosyltransferase family 39 protein [Halpernia frigidisoli]SFI27321.1 4-amino-4-deoxy-L-arabinose transferase [Halpernia frigidisoli]
MQQKKSLDNPRFYYISFAIIVVARLLLNAVIPLMDKTEARYANIARIMAETGNWVTPQIDNGIPFWAKPPLSTWLSAISIKLLGVNEFAVRFPSFVISILLLLLIRPIAKRLNIKLIIPAFILFTVPEFLLHVGVVSTDMTLLLSMTCIMIAFWEGINDGRSYWKYLFFVAIGVGFLAKGPIVIVLTAPPIFVWAVLFGNFKKIFTAFPWILGILLVLIIAVPWYYLAEQKTPGFLDYFFVGEHYKRFFDSSWKGDKYGFPKIQPLGIIWVFLLGLTIPWLIFVIFKIVKLKKLIFKDQWLVYLLFWIIWTPIFFTTSKSLIHTYVLPTSVPIALFIATFWNDIKNKKAYVYTAMILPALSVILIFISFIPGVFSKFSNTDKYVLQNQKVKPLYYLGEKTYSSQFYSNGKVISIDEENLSKKSLTKEKFNILINKRDSNIVKNYNFLTKTGEGKKSLIYTTK